MAASCTYQLSSPSCSTRAIQKSRILNKKYWSFLENRRMDHLRFQREGRQEKKNTRDEIEKGNQMTALRFRQESTSDIPGLPAKVLDPIFCLSSPYFASSLSLFPLSLSLLPVSQVVTTSFTSESVAPGCSLLTASAQIHTHTQALKAENPAVQILENLQVWRKKEHDDKPF